MMPPRADLNLVPGMGYLLMIMMIMLAFQLAPHEIALPVTVNADLHPPAPSEIVLRVDATGRMDLTIDDEWGTTSHWGYSSKAQTREELAHELGRLYMNRTEDRVLVLKADTAVAYGLIEQVILAARDAGVRVVRSVVEEARLADESVR